MISAVFLGKWDDICNNVVSLNPQWEKRDNQRIGLLNVSTQKPENTPDDTVLLQLQASDKQQQNLWINFKRNIPKPDKHQVSPYIPGWRHKAIGNKKAGFNISALKLNDFQETLIVLTAHDMNAQDKPQAMTDFIARGKEQGYLKPVSADYLISKFNMLKKPAQTKTPPYNSIAAASFKTI